MVIKMVPNFVTQGIGFDLKAIRNQQDRRGMIGMRERVSLLGGSFDVASQPGMGTRVSATFSTVATPVHQS